MSHVQNILITELPADLPEEEVVLSDLDQVPSLTGRRAGAALPTG